MQTANQMRISPYADPVCLMTHSEIADVASRASDRRRWHFSDNPTYRPLDAIRTGP